MLKVFRHHNQLLRVFMATRQRWKRTGAKVRRSVRRLKPQLEVVKDPVESAEAAGLRYVSDTMPGIRRKRAGSGFSYVGAHGRRITDPDRIAWFKRLASPPAWTDV